MVRLLTGRNLGRRGHRGSLERL